MLIAGPHLGSEAINVLQGDLGLVQRVVKYLGLADVMQLGAP